MKSTVLDANRILAQLTVNRQLFVLYIIRARVENRSFLRTLSDVLAIAIIINTFPTEVWSEDFEALHVGRCLVVKTSSKLLRSVKNEMGEFTAGDDETREKGISNNKIPCVRCHSKSLTSKRKTMVG